MVIKVFSCLRHHLKIASDARESRYLTPRWEGFGIGLGLFLAQTDTVTDTVQFDTT